MAPFSLRMTLGQIAQSIWLIQQDQRSDCRMLRAAFPKPILKAPECGLPEGLIAVEVWALPANVGGIHVIPWHDVQAQLLRIFEESCMVTLDVHTHRVVQSHIVGAHSGDHTQIVSSTRPPLFCIPGLHQVLTGTAASEGLRARHRTVSDSTHGPKWRQAAWCAGCGDLCSCSSDYGAQPKRVTDRPTPSRCDRLSSISCSSREPRQVCSETMHRPCGTWSKSVTSETSFADDLRTKGEQSKVFGQPSVQMRCLKLEECSTQEITTVIRTPFHSFQVFPDNCRSFHVRTIFADNPWQWSKWSVVFGDYPVNEHPGRPCVNAMDPSRPKCLLEQSLLGAGRILRNLWIGNAGDHVLKAKNTRPGKGTIDRGSFGEAPHHRQFDPTR